MAYSMVDAKVIEVLTDIVGERNVKASPAELYAYSADGGIHRKMPEVVVRPHNAEEVSRIVRLANEKKIPITPRGAGTALCGQSVPLHGGIMIDLQDMKKIKEIRVNDLYCVVEPGLVYDQLNAALKKYKFFFPPDPGSGEACTIGGMVICNASGMHAIKYGATRDYVMAVEFVLPTGEIVTSGTRTLKNSCGYQFERLLAGSEGTLGIITEITLRITPLPRKKAMAVAAFDKLETAGQGVSNIIAHPLLPSALEIMDSICIEAINKAQGLGLPQCEALLFIEVDGHPASVKEEIETVASICRETGAVSIDFTDDSREMEKLQKGRKAMIPSLSKYREDLSTVMLADDMAVPMSKVPAAVKAFHEIAERNRVLIPTYGHAGDGNLHTKVLIDPQDEDSWRRAEKATAEIYDAVLELGGTVTGEHGVGITKAPFARKERHSLIEASRAVKRALDPNNIMNPEKILEWEQGIIVHLRYHLKEKQHLPRMENLAEFRKEMNTCTYCGFCKSVCPVFSEQNWDSSVARGKLSLSYGLLMGDIKADPSVIERVYQCTMCMDCARRCPSGIKVLKVIEAARGDLVAAGFATANQQAIIDNVKSSGNIYADGECWKLRTDGDVPLFLGCQYGALGNRTRQVVKILEKLGIRPILGQEICCGNPMKSLGFTKDFEEQKKKFREVFPHTEALTLCPTCNMFLQEEYGVKTRHVFQAITEKLADMNLEKKLELTATYHDPCHLARGAGIFNEPREILSKLGVEIREMEQNRDLTRCCGGGGGLLISDSALSAEISLARVKQAVKTGARTIVTSCPTCESTLKKAVAAYDQPIGDGLNVKNIWDLLWSVFK